MKGALSLQAQIEDCVEEYGLEALREINNSMDEVAKEAVQKLKATSPKGPKGYANNWTLKRQRSKSKGLNMITVHNKETYMLTHLLENSHVIDNGYGVYGRTAPGRGQHIHIAPVEEWAAGEWEKRVKEALSK